MNLKDWLEWTDARGATLEEHGFREWFRSELADAWDDGMYSYADMIGLDYTDRMANPYRTGGAE